MIIYFSAAEASEEEFFGRQFAGHEVHFVRQIDWVPEEAEIVSVFINHKIDRAFLLEHPHLKLVATRSNSVDHIDLAACRERAVAVCSVPAYGETTVAEHTFALILALSRRLREVMLMPKSGTFSYDAARGFDLAGKTLGILGMGRIGRKVAALARGFSMEVIACDPVHESEMGGEPGVEYGTLEEVLARAHVISLHASLTSATYHILNAATFAQCRRGVLVVNTARGSLIDTQALREALDSGRVGGAGLDVLEDERVMRASASHIISAEIVKRLRTDAVANEARDADRLREMEELILSDAILSRKNVVFTPHVAFNSLESAAALCEVTRTNIEAFLAGAPVHLV